MRRCVPRLFHLRACNFLNFVLQSTAVGFSGFMIDWYHLPTKTIQDLILVIGISNNKPSKVSADGIADLNLSSFGKVTPSIHTNLRFVSQSQIKSKLRAR